MTNLNFLNKRIYICVFPIFFLILTASFINAQTKSFEFATISGDGNPTGNGKATTAAVNFLLNTNNPTGNTFTTVATPLTATFTLSSQQYSVSSTPAVSFGYFPDSTNGGAINIFGLMSGAGAPQVSYFSSLTSSIGSGIDPAVNRAVQMSVQAFPLIGKPTNGKHRMADLTISFNRPVTNPILHFTGLGGTYRLNGVGEKLGYAGEFDYVTSNVPVSFSKLSGTTGLTVSSTVVRNSAFPIEASGANSASGSVLVTGAGISFLTLRVFMKGDGNINSWSDTDTLVNGDALSIGISLAEQISDLAITKTVNNDTPIVGGDVIFSITARNNGTSNNTDISVIDKLPSGYSYVSHVAPTGTSYNVGTGLWTIGSLADGATSNLKVIATVLAAGNYMNKSDISSISGISDPNMANNTSSIGVTPIASVCTTGCNDNTYVNSSNPNTIEYDNMLSVFHSSIIKEADGKVKVWGQGIAYNGTSQTGNILIPQELNSTNYPGLTGNIHRFAAGSNGNFQQFAVLTTTGLFAWGDPGQLISSSIKSDNIFGAVAVGTFGVTGTKADGLPIGVAPGDVKMMFGSKNTLAIVTCTGQAWILSTSGSKYGDGSVQDVLTSAAWHRIKTDASTNLDNVVAVRGTVDGMMALTSNGNIYTWGTKTFLGNSTATASRSYATMMDKPTGITPKMIGMTRSNSGVTYYLLGTNGHLYSLGKNDSRQLGIFSTTDSNTWARTRKSSTTTDYFTNIAWISPQEHEGDNYAAINILTTDGKLWAWGTNDDKMLGGGTFSAINPTLMPGSITGSFNADKLNATDTLIAVETGGHTTLIIKQCTNKFGYVGHRINGSMANGSTVTGNENTYNFSDTAVISVCGALVGPAVKDLKICAGTFANLTNAEPGSLPSGATGIQWWTTITRAPGTQVTNKTTVSTGNYYAFYDPLIVECASKVTVSYYIAGDPEFSACEVACYNNPNTVGTALPTNHGITLLQRAGAENGNWPMIRKGGHTALESNEKGFVITRMLKAELGNISNPKDGMMVYDITDECLKIYTTDSVTPSNNGWKCYKTPACP